MALFAKSFLLLFYLVYLTLTLSYTPSSNQNRRTFLSTSAIIGTSILSPPPSQALEQIIKVTPLARTFIIKDTAIKPIRENDASRLLTNARIILFFLGSSSETPSLPGQILDLTVKRKRERGPGVTPGSVKLALPANEKLDKELFGVALNNNLEVFKIKNVDFLPDLMKSNALGEGDCLLVYPQVSMGPVEDEKVIKNCAKNLGLEVGAEKGGGVVGVLLNGPREPEVLNLGETEGYSLLWYDIKKVVEDPAKVIAEAATI